MRSADAQAQTHRREALRMRQWLQRAKANNPMHIHLKRIQTQMYVNKFERAYEHSSWEGDGVNLETHATNLIKDAMSNINLNMIYTQTNANFNYVFWI